MKCDRCGKTSMDLRDVLVYKGTENVRYPAVEWICKECFCEAYPQNGKIDWEYEKSIGG